MFNVVPKRKAVYIKGWFYTRALILHSPTLPYLYTFTVRWICFPQAGEMLQRALKIGTQQWPISNTSILISRSVIYSVMNIVMNIQQWKDINNWPSTFAHILNTSLQIVRRLDKTGNGSGLTCRAVPQLRSELSETTWHELVTKPEWTHVSLSCFILFTQQRNFAGILMQEL